MNPTFSPFIQYALRSNAFHRRYDTLYPILLELTNNAATPAYTRTQVAEMIVALQRILEEYDAAEAERKRVAYER